MHADALSARCTHARASSQHSSSRTRRFCCHTNSDGASALTPYLQCHGQLRVQVGVNTKLKALATTTAAAATTAKGRTTLALRQQKGRQGGHPEW